MAFVYEFVSWFFQFIFRVFFSTVEVVDADVVPKEGPVILVANHANQFLDGLAVSTSSPRRVSFIAAAKSMKRPIIGHFARAIGAIPVVRPQDRAVPGTGQLVFGEEEPTANSTVVRGVGTRFTDELVVGCSLVVLGAAKPVRVAAIVSDTEARVAVPFSWKSDCGAPQPSAAFKVQPHLNHSVMFDQVWSKLAKGHCIALFPEGGSHDRTELLAIKPGVAIMALGAMAAGSPPVTIVPVGLNYIKPNKFRSPCMIQYGVGWTMPKELLAQYLDPATKRAAVSAVMERTTALMRSVTLNVKSYADLRMIRAIRRMYQPATLALSAADYLVLERRFALALHRFGDHPKVKLLSADLQEYNAKLRTMHLSDSQVAALSGGAGGSGSQREALAGPLLVAGRVAYTIALLLLALPALLLNAPVGVLTKIGSMREQRRALRSSSVKIKGLDVIASYKVLLGLVVIPILYFAYSLAAVLYFRLWALWLPVVFLSMIYLSYLSISLFEELLGEYRVTFPILMAMLGGRYQERLSSLVRERAELVRVIRALVEELGPKMEFWDQGKGRIVPISAMDADQELRKQSAHAIRAPLRPHFASPTKPERALTDITGITAQKPLKGIDFEIENDEQDLFN